MTLKLKKYEIATFERNYYNNQGVGNAVFKKLPKALHQQLEKTQGIFIVDDNIEDFFVNNWTMPKPAPVSNNVYSRADKQYYIYIDKILGRKINLIDLASNQWNYKYSLSAMMKTEISRVFPKSEHWMKKFDLERMFGETYFDEKVFFRLIALNEFLHRADEKETYSQFIETNIAFIESLVADLDVKKYAKTKDLLDHYHSAPLFYMDRSAKKNDEIFGKLLKEDIEYILDNYKLFPIAKIGDYTKSVENIFNVIESMSNNIKPESISAKLSKAFAQSILACPENVDLMRTIVEFANTASDFSVEGSWEFHNDPTKKMQIVTKLHEYSSEINPLDMAILMNAMSFKNTAFRSADKEQSMFVVHLGLNSNDPVGFTKMVSEIVLMHDGVLASYSEWRSELESHNGADTSTNYGIGSELLLDLMARTNRKTTLNRSVNATVAHLREQFKGVYRDLQA